MCLKHGVFFVGGVHHRSALSVDQSRTPFFEETRREPDHHEPEVNDDFPEAKEARTEPARGRSRYRHRPRAHEDSFDVEEDEEHGNHIEADGEASSAGIAFGQNAGSGRPSVIVPNDKSRPSVPQSSNSR